MLFAGHLRASGVEDYKTFFLRNLRNWRPPRVCAILYSFLPVDCCTMLAQSIGIFLMAVPLLVASRYRAYASGRACIRNPSLEDRP